MITKNIRAIINDMIDNIIFDYKGHMQSRHLAVAVKNGVLLTNFKHNIYYGEGSIHAEISVIDDIIKSYLQKAFKDKWCIL